MIPGEDLPEPQGIGSNLGPRRKRKPLRQREKEPQNEGNVRD